MRRKVRTYVARALSLAAMLNVDLNPIFGGSNSLWPLSASAGRALFEEGGIGLIILSKRRLIAAIYLPLFAADYARQKTKLSTASRHRAWKSGWRRDGPGYIEHDLVQSIDRPTDRVFLGKNLDPLRQTGDMSAISYVSQRPNIKRDIRRPLNSGYVVVGVRRKKLF